MNSATSTAKYSITENSVCGISSNSRMEETIPVSLVHQRITHLSVVNQLTDKTTTVLLLSSFCQLRQQFTPLPPSRQALKLNNSCCTLHRPANCLHEPLSSSRLQWSDQQVKQPPLCQSITVLLTWCKLTTAQAVPVSLRISILHSQNYQNEKPGNTKYLGMGATNKFLEQRICPIT